MHLVLRRVDGGVLVTPLTDAGTAGGDPVRVDEPRLPAWIAAHEAPDVRWVWDDTARWYPAVLRAGGRVARCVDLRLGRRLLRQALATRGSALATAPEDALDAPVLEARPTARRRRSSSTTPCSPPRYRTTRWTRSPSCARSSPPSAARPRRRAASAPQRGVGGCPGRRRDPARRAAVAGRRARAAPRGRPRPAGAARRPSPTTRGDRGRPPGAPRRPRAEPGLAGRRPPVAATRGPDGVEHAQVGAAGDRAPAIAPLLEYKRLARLLTANGWAWLDEWVQDGRFHPKYVVGGVVTGAGRRTAGERCSCRSRCAPRSWRTTGGSSWSPTRPSSSPGCSLRCPGTGDGGRRRRPRPVRRGRGVGCGGDPATGEGAMLGAMYGATQGEGGRLVPRLERAFPRALDLVARAARAGERGER